MCWLVHVNRVASPPRRICFLSFDALDGRGLRRSSCSSCVGAITARAHRLRSRNRRVRSSAFLHMVPREHTCVSLCLSHDCGFFPRAFPQSRARRRRPVRLPPLHRPPFRASLPRDCPILRPRAGLPISRGPASLGATRRTRVPSSLRHSVGCCMSAPRHFKHPSSLQPLVVAYLLAAECTQASLLLSCSQDDRDANQLCSGEEQRSQRQRHVGGVFPGRDQDRVRIGRWDDQSLEFWCAGALKSPLLGQS